MYREQRLGDIEHYCYEDVMATYVVWLRMKFTNGDISQEVFENLNDRAVKKLKQIKESAPEA